MRSAFFPLLALLAACSDQEPADADADVGGVEITVRTSLRSEILGDRTRASR